MKALALFMIILLTACSPRNTVELPLKETAPPAAVEEAEETVEIPEEPAEELLDSVQVENNKIIITLGEERSFEGMLIDGIGGDGDIRILADGEEVYKQENSLKKRYCYMGEQTAKMVEVILSEGNTAVSAELIEPEDNESLLSAYLPFNTYSPNMLTDGTLDKLDEVTVNVGCYWQGDGTLAVSEGLKTMLSGIREAYPELKIYCTINPKKGGAGAILTEESRKHLIENMLNFARDEELYGIDIDWEFPADEHWDEFSELIVEFSEALDAEDKRLSLAFYPEKATLSAEAIKVIDKVNVMAYDCFDENGHHSTYKGAVEAVDWFLGLGFEEEQLSLGIPAYGRPVNKALEWPFYKDFAADLADGTNLLGEVYFNSPQLVIDKSLMAREQGLQGVFLYHLGCDSVDGENLSLREAAETVLK